MLVRLTEAEARELNPHWQDDYRIAWITVWNALQGVRDPHGYATWTTLGLRPEQVWPAIIERRKAKLGRFYEEFFGESLPPKKPVESVHQAAVVRRAKAAGERSRPKKEAARNLTIPAALERVECPQMASTARASHNSDGAPRGIYKPEEFYRLANSLPLPKHLLGTFPKLYDACNRPTGKKIQFFCSIETFADKALICKRTAWSHLKQFEKLGLFPSVRRPGKERRTITRDLNIALLYQQNWQDCPRCGHKHVNGHCGHSLGERRTVFRVGRGAEQKRGQKIVERKCRCKIIIHPSPALVRPEAPKPVVAEHRASSRAEQPKVSKSEAAKFALQMKSLMEGRTRHVEQVGGYGYTLSPNDPRYRAPMDWREALKIVAKVQNRGPDVIAEALNFYGYEFEGDSDSSP